MKFQLSNQRPAAVVGKALPLRVQLKGAKVTKRPIPYLTNKKGVLPTMMRVRDKIRLRPVSL